MTTPGRSPRNSLSRLLERVDHQVADGGAAADTISSGFPSLDRAIGGGFRRQDLIVLGGDVGAGKSALALAIAVRAASANQPVVFMSGEMDDDRVFERVLAIEGRAQIDDMRTAKVTDEGRAALGAAAFRYKSLPLHVMASDPEDFHGTFRQVWEHDPALVVVDNLQLLKPPDARLSQAEDHAATLRALKGMALDRRVALLALSHLPDHSPSRDDPRPRLSDFGALGSVKQQADLVLGLFREEMYSSDRGLDGATELILLKNRNGPVGFIDLYFYKQWMRFEDMLDPDR
jgi:replicative DNA helicase